MELSPEQIDEYNRQTLLQLVADGHRNQDDLSGSVTATIAQFIMNMRTTIGKIARSREQTWVTPEEIINAQIQELRRCVVDLEAYKERLTKGVTKQ